MKYIALLRGINVGGKNRVSMTELKACFEMLGFTNVQTYINSGNVIFETLKKDTALLVGQCESAIEKQFGFHVICAVITADALHDALKHAPTWWNKNKADKNNAIFVIAPTTTDEVMHAVGSAKPEYEKVAAYGPIIFWTAPLATYSHTRYSAIVGSAVYKAVTIRNANTTEKLASLCL